MQRWWEWFLSLFSRRAPEAGVPVEYIRLDGSSLGALARSVKQLSPGQKGWISFDEARQLFSSNPDSRTSLTEFDPNGLTAVGDFAAEHHLDRRREDNRVVFTRRNE